MSVHMEDRNVLRRMERERRNQEVQKQETNYDRISPLFSEPYKIIKNDELSTRIQMMLGNFEDGCDVGPMDLCSVFPFGPSTQVKPFLLNSSGSDGFTPACENLPTSSAPSAGSVQKAERWGSLPLLSPPVDPLSPLQCSDGDESTPEACRVERSQVEASLPSHGLLLNLRSKPGLVNPTKPTAYVRPMDGPDQLNSDSPEFKASPETYEPDLKNNISPNVPSVKLQPQSVNMESHEGRVEDILKEMTSWPALLTAIHTPSTKESLKFPNKETQRFPTHTLVSSDTVEQEPQGSSVSSHSDISSSDSESGSGPEQPPPQSPSSSHTQAENGSDRQLGRCLEMKENQQNPKSPCDSHDSPGRTETEGQQGQLNPTHSDTEAIHTQTVTSTPVCEGLRLESTLIENSQHRKNTSTHRVKHNRKKTVCHTKQRRATAENKTQELSVCITKHTDRKCAYRPLLVKIELNLLSRIPQEPKAAEPSSGASRRPKTQRRSGAGPVEKSQRKKRKMDQEEKQSYSSQNIINQSEATRSRRTMKRSRTHPDSSHRDERHTLPPAVNPDSQQKKSKKTCNSRSAPAAKPRPLLQLEHRQHSVEDHMKEAKKLKHKADATLEKMSKALIYLEAALSFVESGVAMETDPQTPKSAFTMFSETVELIRFILKLKNYTEPTAGAHERDFLVLCLRCQSLLLMAMFRHRRDSALKYSQTLAEHFKSSSQSVNPACSSTVVIPQSIQQVAASYVSITALFLNAHQTWEQADKVALTGSGLLRDLDGVIGPLTLMSSVGSLVPYTRQGLHWIRLDTLNSR